MTPHEFVDIARERWRFIATGLVLGAVAAGLAISFVPREYSASTIVIVTPQPDPAASAAASGDEVSAQRISTYVELMQSKRLAGEVITSLRLPETPAQLAGRIAVSTTPDSALITASVTDGASDEAVRVANAIGDAFIRDVAVIEQPTDPARLPPVVAKVFQAAQPPADLVAPRPALYVPIGVGLGLLVGFAAALLRNAWDTRVKTRSQLEEILGVPVLGTIGRDRTIRSSPFRMYGASHTPLAEAFGHLRTNVQVAAVDRQRKSVLVTSAASGEGRTTTVCNLGLALAKTGARVVIVDADLRNPSIALRLSIPDAPGLTELLDSTASVKTFVRPVGPTLDALPSGLCPPNPSELLGSQRMTDLLTSLRETYDVVLIDSAPLLPVTDAAVLASRVDGVLVVVRHRRTRVQDLYASRDALNVVRGRVLGSVLTMVGRTGPERRARLKSRPWGWRRTARPSENGLPREAPKVTTAAAPPPGEGIRPSPRPRPNDDHPSDRSDVDETLDHGSVARQEGPANAGSTSP